MKTLSAALLLLALSPCFAWAIDRNTSGQKITLVAYDTAAGTVKTGDAANLTFYVSKDDGTVTALTDTSASEVSSTNDKGSYVCDLTQGETDAVKLRFSGKSTTSGVEVIAQTIYTLPGNSSKAAITTSGKISSLPAGMGTVYTVVYDGNSATSGTTLINTVGAATAPAVVYVSAGTFALSTTQLDIPAGVHVQCAGVDKTFITSSKVWTSGNKYTQIHLNTGSSVDGFTHTSSNYPISGSNYDFPIGCATNDAAFTGGTVSNFKIIAGTDGIYVNNASAVGLTLRSGLVITAWDTIIGQGGGNLTLDIDDVTCINLENNATGTANGLSWLGGSGGYVRATKFKNFIVGRGAGTTIAASNVAILQGAGLLSDCKLVTSGGATTIYSVLNLGTATTLNCEYDRSKTSGTITDRFSPLRPTVADRTLDITTTGEAGIDWANVGSPTTSVNLSGTTVSTSQQVASVSGAVGSVTGNVGGNVTGSVGSVTGAVASVTGNVGGSVVGSVGSVATGGITSASFASNSITAAAVAADAAAEIGAAAGSAALSDSDFENVPTTRSWKLITNSSNELVGDKTLVLDNDTGEKTFAVDFANDLSANGKINTVDSVVISTGTEGGVTFGDSGRERNLAKVRITGVTAGTYTLECKVTDSEGNPHTGTVTLKVVE